MLCFGRSEGQAFASLAWPQFRFVSFEIIYFVSKKYISVRKERLLATLLIKFSEILFGSNESQSFSFFGKYLLV